MPNPPGFYRPGAPSNGYGGGGDTILSLIMNQGRMNAEAAQRSGERWQNVVGTLGSLATDYFQQRTAKQDQQKVGSAVQAVTRPQEGVEPDRESIFAYLDPQQRLRAEKGIADFEDAANKGRKTRLDLQHLEQQITDARKKGEAEDREALAVGAYHAKKYMSGPDGGLRAITELARRAKAAGMPGAERYDDMVMQMTGAMDEARGNEPHTKAVADAIRQQVGPTIDEMETWMAPATRKLLMDADEVKASKPDTRSLEIQAAELLARGDQAGYERLLKTKTQFELAGNRPQGPGPKENRIWVTRAGDQVFVPESQVRPGDTQGKAGGGSAKPSTGAQKRALAFYNDGKQAADDVDDIADQVGNSVRLKYATNMLQSEEGQKYWQGIRSFSEARLRLRSGAAIPTHEIEKDAQTYFKQPGDTDAVLKQKKASRDRVLDGIAFEAGPAYEEYYGEPAPRMGGSSISGRVDGTSGDVAPRKNPFR